MIGYIQYLKVLMFVDSFKNIIKRIFMSCKIAEHLGVFIMKKVCDNFMLNHYFKKS